MNLRPEETEDTPATVESLRLELEACRRELDESHKRLEQLSGLFAHLSDAMAVNELDGSSFRAIPETIVKGDPLPSLLDALRRLTEENNRLREDFRDLFEEAPIPCMFEGVDTHFIQANKAALKLLGIKPEEVAETFGHSLVADTPENQRRLREAFELVESGKEAGGVEIELRRKDNGHPVWVQWWSRPAPNGEYTRTMMVDITERVLMEQTKAALEFALESGQVGDWELDLIHDTSRRSLRHDRCFGYDTPIPDSEWGIATFVHHVHPDDRTRVEGSLLSAAREFRDWTSEFRVVWPDGSTHWIAASGSIYRTKEGKAAQMLGIVMDVTERKRAEEALGASERLARGQVEELTRALDMLATKSAPDRLMEHISCTITEQLDAHSISVWRRDMASGLIGFEFAYEGGQILTKAEPRFAGMGLWLPMGDQWPWPEVFRTGKPSLISDIRTVPPFALRDRLVALGIISVLLVPMWVAGNLEGAIGIRFARERSFRPEEIELAQALANQAMLALQLTRLSAQSRESAVIDERNRMAREIHDTLAQGFTGVIVQLEAAEDAKLHGLTDEADDHLDRARNLARESLSEARRSVQALRPRALEKETLHEALNTLLARTTAATSTRSEFILQGTPRQLPPEWDENILRITQEALTNTLRHAQASHFKALISFGPDEVLLELSDTGHGFNPADGHAGFGLLGISERVDRMGGQLKIRSTRGSGTTLLIVLHPRELPGPVTS
ncbi:PAS domain S-box protein [Rhodanobacter glycinis]|uniref:sensor histidine kinase n=1 Tax=Rhodanobacter glycinis TaxID=582702 RepID=UPI00112A32A1|nr:GAF domain-containing sensor histidine kinase [Rhodanobacter glycinis]TPG45535.1 PAS domain S-box protein [Rhodanobacter glycinis]